MTPTMEYKKFLKTLNSRKLLVALILAYLAVFYLDNPFIFGFRNNVEEIPLLNEIGGKISYDQDAFVQFHTTHLTQVITYVTLIHTLTSCFGMDLLPQIFLVLHTLTLITIYLSIRLLYRQLGVTNEIQVAVGVVGLYLITKYINLIPADRWLFACYLDPELLVFPFLFLPVGLHLGRTYFWAGICLFIANTLYPIYALFIYGALLVCLFTEWFTKGSKLSESLVPAGGYTLAVMPYLILLWYYSGGKGIADASLIMEILRAPHHYRIYPIHDLPWKFFAFSIVGVFFGIPLLGREHQVFKRSRQLSVMLISMITGLVLTSLVATFVRWPLIIQISPYRMGVVVVVFTWVSLTAAILIYHPIGISLPKRSIRIILTLSLILASVGVLGKAYRVHYPFEGGDKGETIEWIKRNTRPGDLFMSYSDLPIRTFGLRPLYFSFKTIPLNTDAQFDWYDRLRIQYDMMGLNAPYTEAGLREAKRLLSSSYTVELCKAVANTEKPIRYVVVQDAETIHAGDFIFGMNIKHFNAEGLTPVFSNSRYTIYRAMDCASSTN